MATSIRAPKQWCLTREETVNSFENWKQNLLYVLSLDKGFSSFVKEGFTWSKKSKNTPLRGLTDDPKGDQQQTAQQKVAALELMLGQIANYCPVIARNTIVKNSTSLPNIWQLIRLHYGFQSTGAHFLDFADIILEPSEKPEDLYQRLSAFVEDNLLLRSSNITHHSETIDEDEEITPSLENFIVLTWLRLINPSLPKLVKQRYGTELRTRTLSSIKPEISLAMSSLLQELQSVEDAQVLRSSFYSSKSKGTPRSISYGNSKGTIAKVCPLCREGKRESGHFLSQCKYLPESDRKYLTKARAIGDIQSGDEDSDGPLEGVPESDSVSAARRVQVEQSPFIDLYCGHHPVRVTLDSGATGNMIRYATASQLGARISVTKQSANQADGRSPLQVVGEVKLVLSRDSESFSFDGLVVEHLDVDILGGVPFMKLNDIQLRPAKNQITLRSGTILSYGKSDDQVMHTVRRTQASILRSSEACTVWPGEYVQVDVPTEYKENNELILEPHLGTWPLPCIMRNIGGKLRVPNQNDIPIVVKKGDHIGLLSAVRQVEVTDISHSYLSDPPPKESVFRSLKNVAHKAVSVDPEGLLSPDMRTKFCELHNRMSNVFEPDFSGYNGFSGPLEAVINMGPVQPPQRKGRVPQYSRDRLTELQDKFDELERLGVFKRPEELGIVVEYLNPSFLVKKSNGTYRLVTAFADVGRYSKPQPSLMPDVDSTLRSIARWKYIISTDLTNAFFQIPLSRDSLKYCGVVTPFKGVRAYTRCAMGMPGSETALEELMSRVLGDFVMEGTVAKLADDLYVGGDDPESLFANWSRVLSCLKKNNLSLAAHKTTIAPKSLPILGWMWAQGTLSATPHRIASLRTCALPKTTKEMRSFIGAYKVLSRVIPQCADILAPLEAGIAGKESSDKLNLTDELIECFLRAQRSLSSRQVITLPRPADNLWIVTDGASKGAGLGATLYIERDGKTKISGFFSAKLRKQQSSWLPCEIEALSIAAAVKHFSPYIIQCKFCVSILTDSRPCVQAYEKLCRGEYSASPRVSTFLSTVSRFRVSIRHISGAANLVSDFSSRNAAECLFKDCQICGFISSLSESVVRSMDVRDVISNKFKLPFTNRNSWKVTQEECSDLRKAKAHLRQGTRPSKKLTNVNDVKRYLNVISIAKDGLLIVPRVSPLSVERECIVVPKAVLNGLITALHIKLMHPTQHQLSKAIKRYFFALDMDAAVKEVSQTCHQCLSLKHVKNVVVPQTTDSPPSSVGSCFSADIIKRNRQNIFILRECATSFTTSCLVDDERAETLRNAILSLCVPMSQLDGSIAVIRTDAAPGFVSLKNDSMLLKHSIQLEIGREKNPNKNPIAEKANRELEEEIVRLVSSHDVITPASLSIATSSLNSRIRENGMSAREIWTQRDQFTGLQLPVDDREVILLQDKRRRANHHPSEKAKCPSLRSLPSICLSVGDLVYLNRDKAKWNARDRYLVTDIEGEQVKIRKFIGSQLRTKTYSVNYRECYKAQSDSDIIRAPIPIQDSDSEEELSVDAPSLPEVPQILVTPQESPMLPRKSSRVSRPPDRYTSGP